MLRSFSLDAHLEDYGTFAEYWNVPRSRSALYSPADDTHLFISDDCARRRHGNEDAPQQREENADVGGGGRGVRTSNAGLADASPQNHHTANTFSTHPFCFQAIHARKTFYQSVRSNECSQNTNDFETSEFNIEKSREKASAIQAAIMPRLTGKKPEAPKMGDRMRRTSSYQRPKSRTDAGSNVGSRLKGDGEGASSDEDLAKQNTDLRQRLRDEASLYRKRLDTYRLAQQNQATLVSRLQAKVLQYKQRCADLESQIDANVETPNASFAPLAYSSPAAPGSALEQAQQHLREVRDTQHERITDLEMALAKLEEERRKCERLVGQNRQLRDQLDESQHTNEDLTGDLEKLTHQFEELREEMLLKEDEWKDEEQAFNDYYSTEHNRLLTLWRDVVSIKRLFMDVQSSTERDLGKLKNEIETSGRDVAFNCGKLERGTRAESMISLQEPRGQFNMENVELKSQLDLIKLQFENQKADLRSKEDKIQELHQEIQLLEDRCADAEQSVSQVLRLQDEVELLQNSLRDIAHALIQDAEGPHSKDQALSTSHIHLSTSIPLPQQSPKRSARGAPISSNTAFAESTISAVQAALHKHQSVIHELQVKLQSNREQFYLVRKQLDASENQVSDLERRHREAVAQLDLCKNQCSQSCQERETLQKNLESLKSEKNLLDKQKSEVSGAFDQLQHDFDKMQKQHSKQQKDIDILLDEKAYLQNEVDRLNQDSSLREMNLRSEEDRCSRIREELLTTREELNKLYLNNDMLLQQKLEGETLVQHLEKVKSDLEHQLERVSNERSGLHDDLLKKEAMASTLDLDKRKLLDDVRRLEEEKSQLQGQVNDHSSDNQSLRKELLQSEQAKLDLDSDRVTLGEKIKFLEIEKGKVEMELTHVVRDRADLSNQLTVLSRKKESVTEELVRTKQKLEQQNETNARVNRNLEELVHESEEKQCTLDAMDKELQRCQEQLVSVRTEKEALEAVLFDTQTNLEACVVKKVQLENEVQELLVKEESFKGQVHRLQKDLERSEHRALEMKQSLTAQAGTQEVEFQLILSTMKVQHEVTAKKLTEEREFIRSSLEKRLQQTVQQLTSEKDGEIAQLVDRLDSLQSHIENLIQQHEELMLRAENDKQQALLIAHHDQQALQAKLEQSKRDLREERDSLERLKRDSNATFEHNRITINQVKDELNKTKNKLEETKGKCEEERVKLTAKIEELQHDKESGTIEVQNLKVQVHVVEDKIDSLNNQLHDTLRKLKEYENVSEGLRKELTDVRRQLTDCNFEKEKYHASNRELRELVKKVEGEKRDQTRQLEETHQKLSTLEDIRGSLESEKNRLQNVMREAEKDQMQIEHKVQSLLEELQRRETQNTQAAAEEKELQARLLNEVEERERAHQEVHTSKKQLAELERNLEQTRKELASARAQQAHMAEQWHAREQDLLVHLEDCRSREKRLEDQKHNLEVCLSDASQQLHELKAKLSAGESRLRSLETQMVHTDTQKRDVESKLTSVVSTLRRIAGIQLDGSITPQTQRLMSPSRRWSPARTGDYEKMDVPVDIDPESVRKGVRNLMAQVAHVERERDDLKAQVLAAKKQLKDVAHTQSKGETKLAKVLDNVRQLQDEKGALEAKLGQKVVAYNAQADALMKKSEESQQIRDKLTNLEVNLTSCKDDKKQLEDKCEKLKMALHKAEGDKRALQEELGRLESRLAKMELQRMAAEGDLHRLQMMLQERDGLVQKHGEKAEVQARTVAGLEERCASLKSTIDQLNQSLEKASNGESELKVEIQSLQRSLLESTTLSHTGQEKLKHLQKTLANAENDKKIIAERYEGCQRDLADFRRNNQMLQDQINRLNNELANCEVQRSGLESQLRLSQWPTDSSIGGHHEEELVRQLQSVQRERNDLRGKVETLNNKVRQIESENRHLERAVSKAAPARSKSYERQEKYELDASLSDRHSLKFEQENRELRIKISKLESELADREAELSRLKLHTCASDSSKYVSGDAERYRAAQLQAERLLDAREQSHRQQVQRLEHQVASLREQLNQEIKRRQQYVMRSTRAGREMQQLRQALGDSLRTVSQDPSLDALLLEQEARKLDHTASVSTASLPPGLNYDTTQPPY